MTGTDPLKRKKPANSQQRTAWQKLTGRPFNQVKRKKLPSPDQVVGKPKNQIYSSPYREPVPAPTPVGNAFPTAPQGEGYSSGRYVNGKLEGMNYYNSEGKRISKQQFLKLYGN
jgi:hypothetical protein